ncbi:hypothetical protein HGRIS_004508 [Hohenbuehelia grisea]|uniref:Uncharacterized protein n=1 Tax=Hohenbuehelia grisea TaxID=104357 RepID=A0ABR3JCW9_9AGAR
MVYRAHRAFRGTLRCKSRRNAPLCAPATRNPSTRFKTSLRCEIGRLSCLPRSVNHFGFPSTMAEFILSADSSLSYTAYPYHESAISPEGSIYDICHAFEVTSFGMSDRATVEAAPKICGVKTPTETHANFLCKCTITTLNMTKAF